MIPHELAFPGHLTPPDIQAYQQFSNQSGNPLFSPNRLRSLRKAPPLLLDGIDGRLNPESFYIKSKSASKQRQNLLMQEILPTIHFGSSKLGFLVSVKRKNVCFDITDRWGVRRNIDGPFWPFGLGPLGPPPNLRDGIELWEFERARQVRDRVLSKLEHLFVRRPIGEVEDSVTLKRPIVVFDTESSPPMEVRMRRVDVLKEEGELIFESSGTYEYELVLTPDLVTESHVQWFFFQVAGAKCGVEYTFHIVNLLKTKRLVKTGEKVLFYSKKLADKTGNGWTRVGTDTSYGRNLKAEKNPILKRGTTYYELKWNMVFPYDNDVCVFAHCYPYTYTDLKADIHDMMQRARKLPPGSVRCEKLCSTFAGNTCFLITITDPAVPDSEKWAAVLTARVHPGETVGSWNMKGLMELLTHPRNDKAKELRRRYVFKLVPMLNADGVIVGNYSTSLRYFDRGDLQTLGQSVALALLEFHKIRSNETKFTETLIEMGKTMLQEMMLNRILSMKAKNSLKTLNNGQLQLNGDLENSIGSVDDFANAFNEYGDLLVEGDEVDSSSASDASSIHESEFILEEKHNMDVRENSAPVVKRKRRRRKHRKCRRRRKNRRRRLARLKSAPGNPSKVNAYLVLFNVLL
ncbi:unnamed protein product [Taenia asiatica]|uniref:Cytosolic carboxypeptidase 2 n=1 Tax=Taenia asiatica TaxID=60517 RepID=A0A0R3WEA6_TAEAS|nr:unnamed protein product [Taenia asiatica]